MMSYYFIKHGEGISAFVNTIRENLGNIKVNCNFLSPTFNFYSRPVYFSALTWYRKVVVNSNNMNLLHVHVPILLATLPLRKIISKFKKSIITIWNDIYINNNKQQFDKWQLFFNNIYLSSIICRGLRSQLIAPTQFLKKRLEYMGGKRVIYIPAAIDTEQFNYFGINNHLEEIHLLYYGHLTKWKGVENLIKAFSIIKDTHKNVRLKIMWTGFGKIYPNIAYLITKLNLNDKISVEKTMVTDIPKMINNFDIGILPLISSTGTASPPRVLLEMMSCGLPVVATNVDGISEIVENGKNGILCNSFPQSIAEGISILLNESTRKRLGRSAREFIIKNHDVKKILPFYRKLYEELT